MLSALVDGVNNYIYLIIFPITIMVFLLYILRVSLGDIAA